MFSLDVARRLSSSNEMHVLIIGGGIGGMALAAALERVGISYEVHEQAEQLREVGAGLGLWSNALLALSRLDAVEGLVPLGSVVSRLEVRTFDGRLLAIAPLLPADGCSRLPGYLCVHRADILRELMRRSNPAYVRLGSRWVDIEDREDGVVARFADGHEAQGDCVVGADGLRSSLRARLFGEAPPRYAGYTCWRGLTSESGSWGQVWVKSRLDPTAKKIRQGLASSCVSFFFP